MVSRNGRRSVMGTRKRAVHVLEIAGNSIVGGMERYVLSIAEQMPAEGYKISCLAPFESAFTHQLRNLGCEVFVTPMDMNIPWRSIQFACELVLDNKVDLIHAHLPRAHILAGLVGRLTGVPVVATVHGMDIIIDDLSIFHMANTTLSVVCRQAYAQARSLGVPADRLFLVPNGVDLGRYCAGRDASALRKSNDIPKAALLVGFVGRLSWEKGPDRFIQLAGRVNTRLPEAHFVMVGRGPMEDELRASVKADGLEGVFHFAGEYSDTVQVYPALDVLVQTSRVEGMPLSLLEGMACGLPVAAMGVGGVIEIIEAGVTGVLAAEGDWAGLGDAVVSLLNDPQRRQQMGMAARARAEEQYSIANTRRLLKSMFQYLVEKHAVEQSIPGGYFGLDQLEAGTGAKTAGFSETA